MITEWRRIESFPDYSVSNDGFVMNDETGRRMTRLVNQSGVVNVGLTKNRIQYKRSVSLLVARSYIKPHPQEAFDCPINLDGDRHNNRVDNLVWRPRWFAVKYFRQFEQEDLDDFFPIEEIETHEQFYNPWHAIIKYGILRQSIMESIRTGIPVWCTRQRFRKVS